MNTVENLNSTYQVGGSLPVIENWESQDEQAHLRTIRDRLLCNKQRTSRVLGLYQQILLLGEIPADDSREQMQLQLSGLVVKQHGKLRVYNRIYQLVFDKTWVEKTLADMRPYEEAIAAWLDSNCQDESRLLQGQALQEAQTWASGKSLSAQDDQFLRDSQELDKRQVQIALAVKEEESRILAEANQKAKRTILVAFAALAVISLLAARIVILVGKANQSLASVKIELEKTQERRKLEQAGATALQQFEVAPIEALLLAMQSGQGLKDLVRDGRPLEQYPTVSPLLALQTILDNIRQQNQIDTYQKGVNSVSFSTDGKQLATAGEDGTVRLWDLSGKNLAEFKGHQGSANNVRFSPDGKQLATAGDDGTVRLWDLSGKQLVEIKAHQGSIKSINFSPDGNLLATAGKDSMARLWDLNGKLLAKFKGHQGSVNSVFFSPDGKQLATTGQDGTVRRWKLSGKLLKQFKADPSIVESVRFSRDGKLLATASEDGTAIVWLVRGLDELLAEGCDWLKDYLATHPAAQKELHVCQKK